MVIAFAYGLKLGNTLYKCFEIRVESSLAEVFGLFAQLKLFSRLFRVVASCFFPILGIIASCRGRYIFDLLHVSVAPRLTYYRQQGLLCHIFIILGMGNKQNKGPSTVTAEALAAACKYVILHQGVVFNGPELLPHIKTILQHLRENEPICVENQELVASESFLRFIFHSNFSIQVLKVVKLFMTQLEEISKKSLAFLKIEQIQSLTAYADFLLYFTNKKVLETFDSALVRSDVSEQVKSVLRQMKSDADNEELQENGNIVERMTDELEYIEVILRVTITNFIKLRFQTISRSENSLRYFAYLQQSLFMLYVKLYFAHMKKANNNVAHLNEHFKTHMTIGGYFLSVGSCYNLPSLYQTSAIFLYSFLRLKAVNRVAVKDLPSHLFKNLPLIPTHSLYQQILCTVLFTLKYIKEGSQTYVRFAFNRIMSLKLVQVLIEDSALANKIVTYYIEELCLQVKAGQIERACVYQVAKTYHNYEQGKTQVIEKFLESGKAKYNLKFSDRHIKVSADELMTELEDNEDLCESEYYLTSHKFVLERILFRQVVYNFNDRLLWNEILPNIMRDKEDEDIRASNIKIETGDEAESHGELFEPEVMKNKAAEIGAPNETRPVQEVEYNEDKQNQPQDNKIQANQKKGEPIIEPKPERVLQSEGIEKQQPQFIPAEVDFNPSANEGGSEDAKEQHVSVIEQAEEPGNPIQSVQQ